MTVSVEARYALMCVGTVIAFVGCFLYDPVIGMVLFLWWFTCPLMHQVYLLAKQSGTVPIVAYVPERVAQIAIMIVAALLIF